MCKYTSAEARGKKEELDSVLPAPFFAEVTDEFDVYSTLYVFVARKLRSSKRIGEVRGDRLILTDKSFYGQLKPFILKAGMKIVLE